MKNSINLLYITGAWICAAHQIKTIPYIKKIKIYTSKWTKAKVVNL